MVIFAGPMSNHVTDVLECLQSEGIRARLIKIEDVEPARRPDWACTPGNEVYEVYIAVPKEQQAAAHEAQRWMSRLWLATNANRSMRWNHTRSTSTTCTAMA